MPLDIVLRKRQIPDTSRVNNRRSIVAAIKTFPPLEPGLGACDRSFVLAFQTYRHTKLFHNVHRSSNILNVNIPKDQILFFIWVNNPKLEQLFRYSALQKIKINFYWITGSWNAPKYFCKIYRPVSYTHLTLPTKA